MPFSSISPFTLGETTPRPTYVTSGYDRNTADGTNLTQNIPSGVQQGHLMVAVYCINATGNGSGITVPSGWTTCSGSNNGTCGMYFFYKYASSTDAGTTYAWVNGFGKNANNSFMVTLVFRDAKIGAVQSSPVYENVTGNPISVSWVRSVQNSQICPILFNTVTSTTNFTSVTDPSGFTRVVNGIDSVNSYGDVVAWISGPGQTVSGMSGTASSTISGTVSGTSICMGYVEVLPSTAIPPTSPTFHNIAANDYTVAVTSGVLQGWDAPVVGSVGDLQVVYATVNASVTSWTAPSGFTTIYSRTSTSPAIWIGCKVYVSGDTGYAVAWTPNNSATRSGWSMTVALSNAQYDTVGTADTTTLGGTVRPLVTVTNNYSLVLAFLASIANGTWSTTGTMSDNSGFNSLETHTPGVDIYSQTNISSGSFDPGGTFSPGTGGTGSVFGICASFTHL